SFFLSSRGRHTRFSRDWSSDVCSSDLFGVSGLLSALAGVLLTARLTIGQPTAFSGLELDAIAAVVLGGTSLFGGRGGVFGTFIRSEERRVGKEAREGRPTGDG